jgi:dihydrofolate reductase
MGQLTVINHLSLDGVMQGPGRAEEDTRDGFRLGGWGQAGNDAVMGAKMAAGMQGQGSLLLGRVTYEQFARYWPHQTDNPYTERLNATHKYVATRTLATAEWQNTTLLDGDVPARVAELKREENLTILGSGGLIRSLLGHGLIDAWTLLIHPRVLGAGRRLFAQDGPPAELTLAESVVTTTGVLIATYTARG